MLELAYVLGVLAFVSLIGRWIRGDQPTLEPWHVLSENATLRDRLIAHEVSIPVLYTNGVPVDELDLPMPDFEWARLRHELGSVRALDRPTFDERVAYWESVRPYSDSLPPTLRQRIDQHPRRWASSSVFIEAPGNVDRRVAEAEWYCLRAGF